MLLLSVKKAYDKGAFKDISCPVPLCDVEIYIQILMPAYICSLLFQHDFATIGMVIPNLMKLIYDLQLFEKNLENKEHKDFCTSLIHFIKLKFKYEIESPVYKVIQIFLSSKLLNQ